jgi:uncharacterized membrane protein
MAGDRGQLGVTDRIRPLAVAGPILGVGLGGFFDGIVFHQLLQWHHMLSAHPDPAAANDLPLNTFWDGLFHAVTYLFTLAGVALVWSAWRRGDVPASGRNLFGSVLAGWGLFDVVEGLVDHQLLGIHHVWPAGPGSVLLWDLLYLAWGAVMLVVGTWLVRDDPGTDGGPGR